MRLRTTISIGLAILVSAFVIATASLKGRSNQTIRQVGDSQIPIVAHQLPSKNGIIPVELHCETIRPTKRPELLVLTCTIKNNMGKPISAFSIDYSIIFERRTGGEFSDSGLLTLDARIHPDFRESHVSQLIQSGGERVINRGEPIQHEDALAKRIEAKIDYVEFDGDPALGPNVKGSNLIALIREGAAKYKGWLKRKYLESGKSISAIAPLLQDSSNLPAQLEINDPTLILGAEAYQKKARDLYRNRGGAEIEKLLHR